MGAGKSTAGPLVADALGYRFVDLDWLVEARVGASVAAFVAAHGEAAFRDAEAEALAETMRGRRLVVATGGGTLADDTPHGAANRAQAAAAGAIVWLRVPPDVLAARLDGPPAEARPLLHGPDGRPLVGAPLVVRLADRLAAREAGYADAHATVEAEAPPEVVARRVVEALAALGGTPREAPAQAPPDARP